MAEGGRTPTKKEQVESISPDKIALMIELINQHSDYKVVTNEEYDQMNQSAIGTSTPAVRSKNTRKPKPNPPNIIHDRNVQDQVGNNNQTIIEQSHAKPRIPIFSGEEKSEVSFDVWKYEIKCIIREGNYTDTILLQSIRGSLKGKARSLLLSLADDATPSQIIEKLEGVYGNVFSSEALLQKFYSENQQPNQSVAEYGMKLESIIQSAVEKGQINVQAKNEMLRSKFWSGLRDPLLKNASRYKYDTIMDFDQLRKEIRSIELDLSNYSKSNTETKIQQQVTVAQSDKLDELLKSVKDLNKRMESVETELTKSKVEKKSEGHRNIESNRGQFRGQFRGQYRGQYRGQDRGQQRFMNRGSFRGRGYQGNQNGQNQNSEDLNG